VKIKLVEVLILFKKNEKRVRKGVAKIHKSHKEKLSIDRNLHQEPKHVF